IRDDNVGPQLQRLLQALAPVERAGDAVVTGERLGDEPVHVRVVLDDQNQTAPGGRWRGRLRSRGNRTQLRQHLALDESSCAGDRSEGGRLFGEWSVR